MGGGVVNGGNDYETVAEAVNSKNRNMTMELLCYVAKENVPIGPLYTKIPDARTSRPIRAISC